MHCFCFVGTHIIVTSICAWQLWLYVCEGVFGITTVYGLAMPFLNLRFQSLLGSLVDLERFSNTLWVRDVHRTQVSIEAGVRSLKGEPEKKVWLNMHLE